MQTPEKTKGLVRAVMQTSFSVNIWERETSFFHGGHFKYLISIKTTASLNLKASLTFLVFLWGVTPRLSVRGSFHCGYQATLLLSVWIYSQPVSPAWHWGLPSWMNLALDKGHAVSLQCLAWCQWCGWCWLRSLLLWWRGGQQVSPASPAWGMPPCWL